MPRPPHFLLSTWRVGFLYIHFPVDAIAAGRFSSFSSTSALYLKAVTSLGVCAVCMMRCLYMDEYLGALTPFRFRFVCCKTWQHCGLSVVSGIESRHLLSASSPLVEGIE